MNENISLIIGADIVPTLSNIQLFQNADIKSLIGDELIKILKDSDYRIFNLETPLSNIKSPIQKSGPIHTVEETAVNGIKALNPDLLVLSNNHIFDHGNNGIERTIRILNSNNINYIGVGKSFDERNKEYIFEKNNIKIGIYNCCEHEFSIRKEGEWGANPYDPLISFDYVQKLKEKCDFVIVLYHGGKEFLRYPSPDLQKIFRKFADKGATAVIAQHTHCIGSYENYSGSLLVYGQGNFIFDDDDEQYKSFLDNGLLIRLSFSKENFDYSFLPIMKNNHSISIANEIKKEKILLDFESRSKKINDKDFLYSEYKKQASSFIKGYLLNIHIGNKLDTIFIRIFLKFNNFLKRKKMKKTKQKLLDIKNYINCESHRELFLQGLNNLIDNSD